MTEHQPTQSEFTLVLPEHAPCPACHQPMNPGGNCTVPPQFTYPYGAEPIYHEHGIDPAPPCRDCNAGLGQRHHSYCALAFCELHSQQWLQCACSDEWERYQ